MQESILIDTRLDRCWDIYLILLKLFISIAFKLYLDAFYTKNESKLYNLVVFVCELCAPARLAYHGRLNDSTVIT